MDDAAKGATVSDIFISYARDDEPVAARLAEALEKRGWSVFWDRQIRPPRRFDEVIEEEVEAARCVLVLWSASSVRSRWVRDEAAEGDRRKILVPVRLEEATPPLQFRSVQTIDLSGWSGPQDHPGFGQILQAIGDLISGPLAGGSVFETALSNVIHFGDTDVLPYPIESHVFFDQRQEALELLKRMHEDFDECLERFTPYHEGSLSAIGYYGHRWVTQIDPIWNAYLLGLVVAIGEEIENARLPRSDEIVFSYRFQPAADTGALFDTEVGWRQYQQKALDHAKSFEHVLLCDIADFYPRIYRQRLQHSLHEASGNGEAVERIVRILDDLSPGTPNGLPVGGPAARLLSELLLNSVDRLLVTNDVTFCRFADDYHLFAASREQAYEHLVFLSEKLFEEQGLMLQKSKTRILTSAELAATSPAAGPEVAETDDEAARWGLLNLKIHFDPYSDNPVQDYEQLRRELDRHDILGMLAKELVKSRLDPALTRQLLKAVRYLEPDHRDHAVRSLVDSLPVLYPLLAQVLQVIKAVIGDLEAGVREAVFDTLRQLIRERSYLMGVPGHVAYAVRVLAYDPSADTDKALAEVFERSPSLVRRDVILAMARRRRTTWVKNLCQRYDKLGQWERRALLIASHGLGRAGREWRRRIEPRLWPLDRLASEWAERKSAQEAWEIPL